MARGGEPEMTGEQLREIRKRLELTQEVFAARLGIGGDKGHGYITISNYERGVYPIPATVAKLARRLR